jgi:DNA repair protein RadC
MHELKVVRERHEGYGCLKRFRNSAEVYESFREHFDKLEREHFVVLLLDAKNGILGFNTVSVGSLTSSLVHPREVFKPVVVHNDMVKEHSSQQDLAKEVCEHVIRHSAAAIILLHNHPSGDPHPSPEDLHITKRLRDVGEIIGVRILDHLIFGDGKYVSLVDSGYWGQVGEEP